VSAVTRYFAIAVGLALNFWGFNANVEGKFSTLLKTTRSILGRMNSVTGRDEKTTQELPIRRVELIIITGAISAFASLSIDTYLPALPSLERTFSATSTQVQLTLASFFVAFAMGQAFYGPIIDRFGRKRPLCVALLLYAAASAGCALAWSIEALVVMRFVQALGACAGGVIARAIVRDCFDAHETARIFSLLMLVTGLSPMLAPVLGGYVFVSFGWRAIFWLLSVVGIVFFAGVFLRLPETFRVDDNRALNLREILAGYGRLLVNPHYIGYALAGALSVAGMFAYIAGSPFVFIELFHVMPNHFGWIFGMNAFGFVLASQFNARLVPRYGPATLLKIANRVQTGAGLTLLAAALTGAGDMIGIMTPLFVYIACIGFILPNSTALAMAPFRANAGMASALLGTVQFTLGAVASTIIGMLHNQTPIPMASVIAVCGLASFGLYRKLIIGER
jgi:MFS transporter, DHA1 family, multidrug resistance protein